MSRTAFTQTITNSNIDPADVITILFQIWVVGNKGTRYSFVPFYQYVICGEITVAGTPDTCLPCDERLPVNADYWKVCIDGEEFLVPKFNAVVEGYIRTVAEQDIRYDLYYKKFIKYPKDYIKMVFDNTGRTINQGHVDVANHKLYLEIQRRMGENNGKTYGLVENIIED